MPHATTAAPVPLLLLAPSGLRRTFSSGGLRQSSRHSPPFSKSAAAPSVGGEGQGPPRPTCSSFFVVARSPGATSTQIVPVTVSWALCAPRVDPTSRRLSPHDRQGRLGLLLFLPPGAAPLPLRLGTSSPTPGDHHRYTSGPQVSGRLPESKGPVRSCQGSASSAAATAASQGSPGAPHAGPLQQPSLAHSPPLQVGSLGPGSSAAVRSARSVLGPGPPFWTPNRARLSAGARSPSRRD
ncbi:hypothetical protein NDU88_003538 [Pleurodeles waltl]|uniref:Uncharacterized protein n=1 Tax=Pleurodeles waltl TaxID=8319 RepID=A0AAV7LFL2_PLEWA|nr:hypothetical protein NDU88_003538 [Pleurodeles waltl]